MLHRHRVTATTWTSWADDDAQYVTDHSTQPYHVHTFPSPVPGGLDLTTDASQGPRPHSHTYCGAFAGPGETSSSYYDNGHRPERPPMLRPFPAMRTTPLIEDGRGGEAVLVDVARERVRAHAKHEADSMEVRLWEDPSWLPVLTEELGEVARCLNDARHHVTLDTAGLREHIYAELIQLAAMAAAWAHAVRADGPFPTPPAGHDHLAGTEAPPWAYRMDDPS